MLKIKDNVNLKELEKFGFKAKYDVDTGRIKKYEKRDEVNNLLARITYVDNDHCHEPYYEICSLCNSETLYDLFQAGLVEKVSD